MRITVDGISMLLFSSALLLIVTISAAINTINITQSISDGETMVSAGGSFKLGFFSPGSSKNRYLGIWYNKVSIMTVVWVANRETPLTDSSGVLNITHEGILSLLNHNGRTIWSSNSSSSAENLVAQLLDSGNLVVKEAGDDDLENFLWQSFDYPGDTFLPGMKFGRNTITGPDRYLSSWQTPDDPSRGNYTYSVDITRGYHEKILKKNSIELYRSGPWNGLWLSGSPQVWPNPVNIYELVFDGEEIYYRFHLLNKSILSRLMLNPNANIQRLTWTGRTPDWMLTVQVDNCDRYALCGAYGSCSINNSPVCDCLKGFVPKVLRDWDKTDWSSGCVRKIPLNCSGDGFRKYSSLKLPETRKSWFSKSMNLEQCRNKCMKNCSCTAYANLDIRERGSGCLLWFNDLIDLRQLNGNGQDIYIRMAATEIGMKQYSDLESQGLIPRF